MDAGVDGRGAFAALAAWLRSRYGGARVLGVGHRVVHGGARYARPTIVTPKVLEDLRALVPLAPLHQPYNLAAIDAVIRTAPWRAAGRLFRHQLSSRTAGSRRSGSAAPRALSAAGVQRYGFHGLSYEYIASVLPCRGAGDRPRPCDRRAPRQRRQPLRDERRQERGQHARVHRARRALHGHEARSDRSRRGPLSLPGSRALREGSRNRSSTRSRACSAYPGSATTCAVLLGSSEPGARLAVDYFVYRAAKEIGALAAVLGGIDGLVFTAGIGENSAEIRQRICEASAWLGIELDEAANDTTRTADLPVRKPRIGVGDPDERRTDHRPSHRRAAGTASEPAPERARAHGHR